MDMRPNTHNGFVLRYDGWIFPAQRSNQISYACFCFMGGLSNDRLCKVVHRNGTYFYFTYHRIDIR